MHPAGFEQAIRDRLNLGAGAILDFQIQTDNTLTARQVPTDARRFPGVAHVPARGAADRRANGRGRVQAAARQALTPPVGPQVCWPMMGIDTAILLRLWLNDDPAQNTRIDALLAAPGGMPGCLLVTNVVLAEAVWTLKSAFDQDKHAQSIAAPGPLDETALALEDREAVAVALGLFEAGSLGFADCMVVARHARPDCEFTATLYQAMRQLPGVNVLCPSTAKCVTLTSHCSPSQTVSPRPCCRVRQSSRCQFAREGNRAPRRHA